MKHRADNKSDSDLGIRFPTCGRCGKTLPRDVDDVDLGGVDYCDECHNDPQTIMCRNCGGYIPDKDLQDDNGFCPFCSGS